MVNDEIFMKMALDQAKRAYANFEIPVGAIIVDSEGKVLSRAYNQTEKRYGQANHAEVLAIAKAGKKVKDWRLEGCTLYVTLEPCFMCMGLIGLSRIERLVFGASSPLFGFGVSFDQMLPKLYRKHIKSISCGIFKDEAAILLKKFFIQKRKKGEQFG